MEQLLEKGIVISSNEGFAEVVMQENDNCHQCGAKIFCHSSNDIDKRTLTVKDTLGVVAGDKVVVSLKGKALLGFSFLLYGVPLILLVTGILVGDFLFSKFISKEFYSFLFSVVMIGCYYLIVFKIDKNKKFFSSSLPEVISIVK